MYTEAILAMQMYIRVWVYGVSVCVCVCVCECVCVSVFNDDTYIRMYMLLSLHIHPRRKISPLFVHMYVHFSTPILPLHI